jgi:hypothetical protein
MNRFLSCLQHSRPCCIGYTNSSRRLEFVYPIQHGRSLHTTLLHTTLHKSIQHLRHYTIIYKAIRHYATLYNVIQDYITTYKGYTTLYDTIIYMTLYNVIQNYTTIYKVIRHYTTLYNVIQDYQNYDTIQECT